MENFSLLTLILLMLGWCTHWLLLTIKARKTAAAAKTELPDIWDYWTADLHVTFLSIIGVVVIYLVAPELASRWPDFSTFIGSTAEDPMNPLAAYLGGLAAPWLADFAGKRLAAMVGD